MKIPCTHCNQSLDIPEELAGQTIECPACNASFDVPVIVTVPSATSQVQATKQETKTANVKEKSKASLPLKYLIAVCALVGLLSAFLFKNSGDDPDQNISSNKIKTNDGESIVLNDFISEQEVNDYISEQDFPRMIDKSTRVDSIDIDRDRGTISYKYTIIDKSKFEIDQNALGTTVKPHLIYELLVSETFTMRTAMRELGVILKYNYFDKQGDFVYDFTVSLKDLTTNKNISPEERPLFCYVREVNKNLPLMLDKETRLEKMTSRKNTLNYRYTFINSTFDSVDKKALGYQLQPPAVFNYAVGSTPTLQLFRERYVTMHHLFLDKAGEEILNFSIGPENLIAPDNIPQEEQPAFCFAREASKFLPLIVDAETRLDRVSASTGKLITIEYTVVNYLKKDINNNFDSMMKEGLIKQYTGDSNLMIMFNSGVQFKSIYLDKEGVIVFEISIDKSIL